jgi:hypothetical protein
VINIADNEPEVVTSPVLGSDGDNISKTHFSLPTLVVTWEHLALLDVTFCTFSPFLKRHYFYQVYLSYKRGIKHSSS